MLTRHISWGKAALLPLLCAALVGTVPRTSAQSAPRAVRPSVTAASPVTPYTDRAAFAAASTNTTTLNFQSANTNGVITGYDTAAGLTLGGVNFVGTENGGSQYTLATISPAFFALYRGFDGNPTVLESGGNNAYDSPVITISLPAGTTAVGTNLYTGVLGDGYANTPEPVDFTLYSGGTSLGTYTVQTFEKPTLAFAGFTSAVPITSIKVVGENVSFTNLSSFVFGESTQAAPVNSGPVITINAIASAVFPGTLVRQVNVTTANTGGAAADMFQITSVTLNSVIPIPPPVSDSPVPTTPNNLSNNPGMNTQMNGFAFAPSLGTKTAILRVKATYTNPNTGITSPYTGTIRLTLP